ncbi:hypothetical protein MHYP_G00108270 [Metynnis hypsauchen]
MLSKKITFLWILIDSLYRIGPVQAVDLQQKPSFISANLGEAVMLYCTFDEQTSNERMVWYKQKVGQTLQQVGIILTNVDTILSEEFKQSGIQLKVNKSSISLTIPHITKDDEGTYFCGLSHANVIKFSTGTFLSVTVRLQQGSVVENPTSQDSAAVELVYAAKRLRMKSGRSGHSVYSEVRYFSVTDPH